MGKSLLEEGITVRTSGVVAGAPEQPAKVLGARKMRDVSYRRRRGKVLFFTRNKTGGGNTKKARSRR